MLSRLRGRWVDRLRAGPAGAEDSEGGEQLIPCRKCHLDEESLVRTVNGLAFEPFSVQYRFQISRPNR